MKQNLKKNGITTFVKVVSITPTNVVVHLNGEEFLIPYTRVPLFLTAKIEDVFDVRMNGLDEIRWEKLDIDLAIESLKHPEKYPLIVKYIMKEEQTAAAEPEIKYNPSTQ